jgi:hypothetical protein
MHTTMPMSYSQNNHCIRPSPAIDLQADLQKPISRQERDGPIVQKVVVPSKDAHWLPIQPQRAADGWLPRFPRHLLAARAHPRGHGARFAALSAPAHGTALVPPKLCPSSPRRGCPGLQPPPGTCPTPLLPLPTPSPRPCSPFTRCHCLRKTRQQIQHKSGLEVLLVTSDLILTLL